MVRIQQQLLLPASINAERCDIYTDVDGVFTTDPNIDMKAKKIDKVSYEEMLRNVFYRRKSFTNTISGISYEK